MTKNPHLNPETLFEQSELYLRLLMRFREFFREFREGGFESRLIEDESRAEKASEREAYLRKLMVYRRMQEGHVKSASVVGEWLHDVALLKYEKELVEHVFRVWGPHNHALPRDLQRELEYLLDFDDSE